MMIEGIVCIRGTQRQFSLKMFLNAVLSYLEYFQNRLILGCAKKMICAVIQGELNCSRFFQVFLSISRKP